MKTMLKLVTLGAVLASPGAASAGTPIPTASRSYSPGPAPINPQPLPPERPNSIDSSSGRAPSPMYPPGPVRINPQPLPPLPRRS